MIIEEMLNQRILGVKNEKGVYITPAFPKLIYVLEEDNIHENSKYWYLTKLSCTMYSKTYGSRLHFRENHEEVKRRKLLPMYGMPFFLNGIS